MKAEAENKIDQMICSLNDSIYHRDESVLSALEGIKTEESEWQHPAYSEEVHRQGMPPPGTIVWHVAHLVHSCEHYAAIIRERPVQHEPDTRPADIHEITELISSLRKAHEKLIRTVSGIPDSELSGDCARGMTLDEFLRMVIRHNTWHAGQIRLLRRLWQHNELSPID
jgi:uncharacterized damage-inducible protein DinB